MRTKPWYHPIQGTNAVKLKYRVAHRLTAGSSLVKSGASPNVRPQDGYEFPCFSRRNGPIGTTFFRARGSRKCTERE
jgi:hypothetical protein